MRRLSVFLVYFWCLSNGGKVKDSLQWQALLHRGVRALKTAFAVCIRRLHSPFSFAVCIEHCIRRLHSPLAFAVGIRHLH